MKPSTGKEARALNLRPILEIVKRINSERNLRPLVELILDTMIEHANARRGAVAFFKDDRFNAELARGTDGKEISPTEIGPLGSVLKRVRDGEKAVSIDDTRRDAGVKRHLLIPGHDPLSLLCLPLRVKDRLMGAVYLDNADETAAFGPREREFAEILTDHAGIAIENALLHRQTTRDRTTGVTNHPHFEDLLDREIARARRLGYPVGLVMIDVDNFKQINDVFGHEEGSRLLRDVAYTLQTTVRGADIVGRVAERAPAIVGRYGGDEFEIVLPGATREGGLATARRLVTLFHGQRFMCGGRRLRISISAGVAVYPQDAGDAQTLMLRADEALYASKKAGKGRAALAQPLAAKPKTTALPRASASTRA
jgi:diguanylate cyclase (GGDEF)-like protein